MKKKNPQKLKLWKAKKKAQRQNHLKYVFAQQSLMTAGTSKQQEARSMKVEISLEKEQLKAGFQLPLGI